jgi:aldose 1-epimerase
MRFAVHHFQENGFDIVQLKDNTTGTYANIIPRCGAILNAFGIMANNSMVQVIDGFESYPDWDKTKEAGFKSAKLSPFVCRIYHSKYSWQGKDYVLDKFSLDGSALHGLIYDAPFKIVEEACNIHYAEIELRYVFPPGYAGYPFSYECYVRYRLEEDNTLGIITAIHNRSAEPLPVADGWHPYFGFGKKVNELVLRVSSDTQLEYNSELIPTGKTIPDGRWYNGLPIGDISLDNGYVLDFTQRQPLCTLHDPESGVSIDFLPDASYPYLQLYIPDERDSIAIENLSAAPDAFNNKMGLTILEPDHTKTYKVKYRLRQEANRQ